MTDELKKAVQDAENRLNKLPEDARESVVSYSKTLHLHEDEVCHSKTGENANQKALDALHIILDGAVKNDAIADYTKEYNEVCKALEQPEIFKDLNKQGLLNNIPDGWQLVPIEPTEDMKKAASDLIEIDAKNRKFASAVKFHTGTHVRNSIYKAMISTAPSTGGDDE